MSAGNIQLKPVDANVVLKDKAYEALRSAIGSLDIYSEGTDTKLDERRLAVELGVSRTPVREALTRLEQEGLVRMIPRRGVFVVRKTKREILEMLCVWGSLEGLAARLASSHASDEEIAGLREEFAYQNAPRRAPASIREYCDENIRFHQSIIRLGKCGLLSKLTGGLLIHMLAISARSMKDHNRGPDLMVDHMQIMEALERRDGALAERLVREHTDLLARHIETRVSWAE